MPGVKVIRLREHRRRRRGRGQVRAERTWPPSAPTTAWSCTAWSAWPRTSRTSSNNYTRFICISKKLEIYPGADKTSLMMVLPHQPRRAVSDPGAASMPWASTCIKLESRPVAGPGVRVHVLFRSGDLGLSPTSSCSLVDDLDAMCEEFQYLGSYSEVIWMR